MLSVAVRPGVEHEKFPGHRSAGGGGSGRHKFIFNDIENGTNSVGVDIRKSSNNNNTNNKKDVIAAGVALSNLTDKLNMGFGSVLNVKGGPCSFSSTTGSCSSSPSCSSCQDIHLLNSNGNDEGRTSNCRRYECVS